MTLAIVALVATLVVPRLVGRGRASLPVVAHDVTQRLTAARWQAIVEGRPVSVPLDDLPEGLHVTEETNAAGVTGPDRAPIAFTPLPAALPRTIVLTDTTGSAARITIPAGLAALAVAWEAPS